MGQRVLIRAALIAAVLASGCYSPGVNRCLYHCTADRGCPDNLTCNTDNWCARAEDDTCDNAVDAAIDVAPDSSCGWDTSNIDVCANAFVDVILPWTIGSATVINTDAETVTPPLPAGITMKRLQQIGGGEALVIAVGALDVNAALDVHGAIPLIIFASETAVITSDIIVAPTVRSAGATCDGHVGAAATGTKGGGGGGGGSFGGPGASGGDGGKTSGAAPQGGAAGAALTVALTPLTGGCPGGDGGSNTANKGGRAGGGIQISARTRIRITGGTVQANGAGGSAASASNSGGGGGGAGGGILLESPEIKLMLSRLCANGGGGGGSQAGFDGLMSDCSGAAIGGGQPGTVDVGGDGATAASVADPGRAGMAATMSHGGGGGGGGLGRIRLRTAVPDIVTSTISPAATP